MPAAPILAVVPDTEARLVIGGDVQNGDTVFVRYGLSPTLIGYAEVSGSVGPTAAFEIGITKSSLPFGTCYFQALTSRNGALSLASQIVSLQVPAPPPTYTWVKSAKTYRIFEGSIERCNGLSLTECRWLCGILKITPP